MDVQDLIANLRRRPVPEPAKQDLGRILAEIGVDDVYFCRLPSCGRPFIPKKQGHAYCCSRCSDTDWNVARRRD